MAGEFTASEAEVITEPLPLGLPRAVEASLALIGLAAAAPLIGIGALAIVATSRGPVFFRQERVGQGGRVFKLHKLRTMKPSTSGPQVTAGTDNRITPVGKLLRKTKLDELPELWNVVKGEMSLVGPRPEVPRYVDMQNMLWRQVLRARPGITDPMTLILRNEETLLAAIPGDRELFYLQTLQPVKLQGYDQYLKTRSWWTDTKVLCETALAILFPSRAPVPTLEQLSSNRPNSAKGTQPQILSTNAFSRN